MSAFNQNLLHSRILIIEDDFIGRATLVQILKKAGFLPLAEAENGKDGLEKLGSFKPDLIICDIQMPEMDGFEFCRHVRSDPDPSISNLPILVQTALTESGEKARIFHSGAADYISKPVDPTELVARCKVHLEREYMTRSLRDFNMRVTQELETAKSTQSVLLPDKATIAEMEKAYGLHIEGLLSPCSELGGDFWSLKPISSHEFAVFTVDFSGHGVNAALNVFRLHAIIHGALAAANIPNAYLAHLNATLSPLLPPGQFATMFYGVINTKTDTLSYASAAAPAPIIFRRDGTHEVLDASGMLLVAKNDANYETRTIAFTPGDCLLLYSDALIETPDDAGNMLSIESVIEHFLKGFRGEPSPQSGHQSLRDHFKRHYMENLDDDLTLVALTRL